MKTIVCVLAAAAASVVWAADEPTACPGGVCPLDPPAGKVAEAVSEAPEAPAAKPVPPLRGPMARPMPVGRGMPFRLPAQEIYRRLLTSPKAPEVGKLGLTDEQKAKLAELAKADRAAVRDERKAQREAQVRQAELMAGEAVDEAALMASIDAVFAQNCAAAKRSARTMLAVRDLLTPGQRAQALEILGARHRPPRAVRPPEPPAGKPEEKLAEPVPAPAK